jgi:hypothetical protein
LALLNLNMSLCVAANPPCTNSYCKSATPQI